MITRVGIDPGVHECGVAIACNHPTFTLLKAWQVSGPVDHMVQQILDYIPAAGSISICVEGQQIYRSEKSKGNPNDMIRVAQVAGGMLWALVCESGATAYEIPLPRAWKGATPKAIHHERLKRDYPQWIDPVAAETTKSKQHHVWDAVGLLEWHRKQTQ